MQKKHELKLIYCTMHKNETIVIKAVGLTSSKAWHKKKGKQSDVERRKKICIVP